MVFVKGDGSLDFDGLEFGVSAVFSSLASIWLSPLIVTRRWSASMVCVKGDGFLDFDGLEFGV